MEHNDSLSSGEEDDDEDNFETLTAESLFSTLLSRVSISSMSTHIHFLASLLASPASSSAVLSKSVLLFQHFIRD